MEQSRTSGYDFKFLDGELVEATTLDSLLRGELSAVSAYRIAAEKHARYRSALEEQCASHERRASLLHAQLESLGKKSSKTAGAWGALVRGGQHVASLLGARPGLLWIEEGERHGVHVYERELARLGGTSRDLIVNRLLPEQRQSCARIVELNTK